MKMMRWSVVVVLMSWAAIVHAAAPRTLEIREGDTICLVGNTLAERMQHFNHWETLLHQRFPKHKLTVRNLAWPADEVVLRPRAEGFGEPDKHLAFSKADVILAFFGFNESFAGPAGVEKFKSDLSAWVDVTSKSNYSGKGAPRIALVSPIAHQNLSNPNLPDGNANNRNIELYVAAIREVAAKHGVVFVDVFGPTWALFAKRPQALTINGVHLNEAGDREFAPLLDQGLFGVEGAPRAFNEPLRRAIADKNFHWYHRYRIVNSYYVYGGRSGLKFADGPQTNRDVLERERETLDVKSANRDALVWRLAQAPAGPGSAAANAGAAAKANAPAIAAGGANGASGAAVGGAGAVAVDDSNVPAFLPVVTSFGVDRKTNAGANTGQTSKTAEGESAAILPPDETAKKFKLAPGYAINLFASEAQFPELGNACATAFDAKGRLWVSTMPTYPQWRPGDPMVDKLVILEDVDGDGKADKSTVFADGLHLPIGFEFALGGVLVSGQRELLFLKDTDGDDRADVRQIVLSGFDSADSHHVINAFVYGPGGDLYFQEGTFHHTQVETPYGPVRVKNAGTFRYEPLSQKLDVFVSYSYANPHGMTFDKWGQPFISDSSGGANYFATAFSGHLPYPEKHATMKHWFTKRVRPTSGCEFVTSRHFPDEAQGEFLLNNTIGVQGVLRHKVTQVGSGFEGKEIEPLLLSDDVNFRPVDMEFGPDGALYLTDWQDALIGHMQYSIRDPLRDRVHARIWRVTYPSRPLLKPAKIAGASIEALLELLKEQEDRTRSRAKQELSTRPVKDVLAATAKWVAALDKADANYEHRRLEGLWVHQWLNVVNGALLADVLRSPEPMARAAATRVLCYWRDRVPNALELLHVQAKDAHPLVRLEAVRAASFFTGTKAVEVALEILNKETDYYLNYTLEETMRALDPSPADVKDPRALAFVLGRMTNQELAEAPGNAAVYAAQVERKGFDASLREKALAELAKARGTSREAEIAAALVRMDERYKDTGAAVELGRLLASSPAAALEKISGTILRMATKDHSLTPVRRAGMAARVTMEGGPQKAWEATEASTDSRALLLEGVALIGDPTVRAKFQPLVAALLAKPAAEIAANVRGAALRALPLLGEENAGANFVTLAAQFRAGLERATAARAMLQLPRTAWSDAEVGPLATSILEHAKSVPTHQRTAQDFIETVQLGNELAAKLPVEEATRIRKGLRELGVRVFVVRAAREKMAYDTTQLVVEAGKAFEVIFENADIMPHNLVVVKPGTRVEVGTLANSMPPTPDKAGRVYVPDHAAVLAATKMLEPGESERLRVRAPEAPGDYEYVCTFPGHWTIMFGKLVVTKDVDAYLSANPGGDATGAGAAAAKMGEAGHGAHGNRP